MPTRPREPLQLQNTWEDERGLGEVPDDKRMGNIVPPCVVARNDGPNKFRCHCCGESGGYDVQLPLHVFMTAYRHPGGGGKLAVHCLREMAQHLVRRAANGNAPRTQNAEAKSGRELSNIETPTSAACGAWPTRRHAACGMADAMFTRATTNKQHVE